MQASDNVNYLLGLQSGEVSPLLFISFALEFLLRGGVTCQLSALPLKAEIGPRLSIRLLLIILLFCCTIYAGSTSIGSLGNFPLAESSPTSFDYRWFCFYPWEFNGMVMPNLEFQA